MAEKKSNQEQMAGWFKPRPAEIVSSQQEEPEPAPAQTVAKATRGKKEGQATFYLPGLLPKLDELAADYYKATNKRINRNDIVRFLVDRVNLRMLLDGMEVED